MFLVASTPVPLAPFAVHLALSRGLGVSLEPDGPPGGSVSGTRPHRSVTASTIPTPRPSSESSKSSKSPSTAVDDRGHGLVSVTSTHSPGSSGSRGISTAARRSGRQIQAEDAAQVPGGVLTEGEDGAVPGAKSFLGRGSYAIHATGVESSPHRIWPMSPGVSPVTADTRAATASRSPTSPPTHRRPRLQGPESAPSPSRRRRTSPSWATSGADDHAGSRRRTGGGSVRRRLFLPLGGDEGHGFKTGSRRVDRQPVRSGQSTPVGSRPALTLFRTRA